MIRSLAFAAALASASPALADGPPGLPLDLGGAFTLIDQTGAIRRQADPEGNLQLVFFGYANCPDMCLVTLPFMGQITYGLEEEGIDITPVMITVDPDYDTPEVMTEALAAYHPDFVGLTGDERQLARVYDAFNVEFELLFVDPSGRRVYFHPGPLFLLDQYGEFLTILPPILPEAQMLGILRSYAVGTG